MSDQSLDLSIQNTNSQSNDFLEQPDSQAMVSWWAYAKAYDLMCEANPAYQDNLALVCEWIQKIGLPDQARICDLGAGTGNYLKKIGQIIPHAQLIHMDWNSAMTSRAEDKYKKVGLNVEFLNMNIDDVQLEENSLDAAICINALYSFPHREEEMKNLLAWLKPGGFFLVLDMGRHMDTNNWALYMMKNYVRQFGVFKTIKRLYNTRAAFPANRHVREHQDSGVYWLHTPDMFETWLKDRGFLVEHMEVCYREVGDFAVCRKPG